MSSNHQEKEILNKLFFNKYLTVQKLGEGSFGMIYKGKFKDEEFALKFENRKRKNFPNWKSKKFKYEWNE